MMMRFNRYLPAKRIPERGPFEQTCADLGIEGYEELVLVEQIPATDAVATALGIDLNATVAEHWLYVPSAFLLVALYATIYRPRETTPPRWLDAIM